VLEDVVGDRGQAAGDQHAGVTVKFFDRLFGIYARQGDAGGAAAAYRALVGDGAIDSLYRDLAVILGAYQELNDPSADLPALAKRLERLRAENSPWRYSAGEISGLLARRAGDRAKAKELFQGLANDPRAPQGVRARAQEMLSIIGK